MNGSGPDKVLLLAIGNSGRQDDGLGWAFAEALERSDPFCGTIEYRYQLQIEDAALVSQYDQVVFVDASREAAAIPFSFGTCPESPDLTFSSHALSPPVVLYLCRQLYDKVPEAWLLGIGGYEWGLESGLTHWAERNLVLALAFFYERVRGLLKNDHTDPEIPRPI